MTNIANGAGVRWILPATGFAIEAPTLLQQNSGTLIKSGDGTVTLGGPVTATGPIFV